MILVKQLFIWVLTLFRLNKAYRFCNKKYAAKLIDEMRLTESTVPWAACNVGEDLSTPSERAADIDLLYRHMIGNMLYLTARIRPEIAVTTSTLAQHVEHQSEKHVKAVVRKKKYLNNLQSQPYFGCRTKSPIRAYIYCNWDGEAGPGQRPRFRVAKMYENTLPCYRSSLQKCVTLSSTEIEYVAFSEGLEIIAAICRVTEEPETPQNAMEVAYDSSRAITCATGRFAEDY